MSIYIESYGCTRRKLEVSKFHKYFTLNGYEIVAKPEKANIIFITTCAFKYDEEEASLKAIDTYSKYKAKIIVYGCLPDIAPTKYHSKYNYINISPKNINDIDNHFEGITYKFNEIDDANLIDTKYNYSSLPKALNKFTTEFELSVPFIVKSCRYIKNKYLNKQQMYYLSACRGCLGNCSYCAVKFAVGTVKSKAIDTVIKEFSQGIDAGYKDFSVLGDDVGAYGQDTGSTICELISALNAEIEKRHGELSADKVRLHIEEINPRWILAYHEKLIDLLAAKSIKSLLCPMQSGNSRILKLMDRGDSVDHLLLVLNEILKRNPALEINTQIIVGFPSETEREFEESLNQLSKVAFNSVVLFPYDDKENTQAFEMQPKVPDSVKQERIQKAQVFLRKLGIKSALCCNET